MGNRANLMLLLCTYRLARYSEAGFATPAMVGNLSQSSATIGRAVGHSKSRRLFGLLDGAERRGGIIVLPPRSTFSQTHATPTTSRKARPAPLVEQSLSLSNPAYLTTARSPHTTSAEPLVILCEPCGRRGCYSVTKLVEWDGDAPPRCRSDRGGMEAPAEPHA
jgi:hypothetical protein